MPKRTDFVIGNERVSPGTRRTVHVPVSVLSDHTPVTMSVMSRTAASTALRFLSAQAFMGMR